MIELLLKAVDRVIELARIRGKCARARYDEIYKPSFNELQSVHADYLAMFVELQAKLAQVPTDATGGDPLLREAFEFLRARRVTLVPVRQKLWELTKLADGSRVGGLPEDEVAFIRALGDYFVAGGMVGTVQYASHSTTVLDSLERFVLRRIAPSEGIRLGENLREGVPTLADVQRRCREVESDLQRSWAEAVNRFNQLRLAVAQSAS